MLWFMVKNVCIKRCYIEGLVSQFTAETGYLPKLYKNKLLLSHNESHCVFACFMFVRITKINFKVGFCERLPN